MENRRIIASLTSFPLRAATVHRVIETILKQTVRPDKIILYLAEEQFPGKELPQTLTGLAENNPLFEIRWWPEDIRSFKKLVPALVEFPEDYIVTFNDDILYPRDIIERLMKRHRQFPEAICGCRVRRVAVKNGDLATYHYWKRYKPRRLLWYGSGPKLRNMATTGGGTLFPPHSLHPEVLRADVFMKICPTTDDLWFYAMAVLGGTQTVPTSKPIKIKFIQEGQQEALRHVNIKGQGLNSENMRKIVEAYPEVKARILDSITGRE